MIRKTLMKLKNKVISIAMTAVLAIPAVTGMMPAATVSAADTYYVAGIKGQSDNVTIHTTSGSTWTEGLLRVYKDGAWTMVYCADTNKEFTAHYATEYDLATFLKSYESGISSYSSAEYAVSLMAIGAEYIRDQEYTTDTYVEEMLIQCYIWRILTAYDEDMSSNYYIDSSDSDGLSKDKQLSIFKAAKQYAIDHMDEYETGGYAYYNGEQQPTISLWATAAATGYIKLVKSSADTNLTANNSCYSLKGAVYGIYSDEDCENLLAKMTTDSDGVAYSGELDQGTYYVKEISASTGYELDTTVYTAVIDDDNDTKDTAVVVKSGETPGNDPVVIQIDKVDSGNSETASLAGAQFTIKYYAGEYTKSTLPSEATKTWVIQAKEVSGRYIAVLADSYKVSGDAFYYNDDGAIVIPYGTITIQETKAADGYTLDGGYIEDSNGNKIEDMSTAIYLTVIDGTDINVTGHNVYTIYNDLARGDFELNKKDEETQAPMSVPFKITNDETGESHIFYTDENGYYSSASSYVKHSSDTNGGGIGDGLWFGDGDVNDSLGALPLGTYTVQEQSCDANAGKKLVSFQITISETGAVTQLGTITNADISLGTTVQDEETGSHYSIADNEISLLDTARYTGLEKGETYVITGTLMNKDTGKAITDSSGNAITASKEFTALTEDGTVEVEFIFDGSDLAGQTLVAFETITLDGEYVVSHEDLTDEGQTIYIPGIGIQAIDSETGINLTNADDSIVIVDTVAYTNLRVGKTYTVTGTLMNKDTGEAAVDADGNTITAPTSFKAETTNGTVDVTFEFDGSNLAGETLVAFEDLTNNGTTWATHADINDEDQTVYVPEIHTTALDDETGIQNSMTDEEITIIDTVSYSNLIAGKEYTVSGVLMDKATGEELLVNGETITAEATFTAEDTSGSVDLSFTFDGTGLEGTTVVVFEDLYYNGVEVAVHADINDEDQSVYIPEIHTNALDEETKSQNALADEEVTIVDTITYTNLVVGKEYTVTGQLYNAETGEELIDPSTGEIITGETTFTAKTANGTVDVTFTFDASELAGETVVVFEAMYYDNVLIALHMDLEDESQMVYFPDLHTTAVDKSDGDHNVYASGTVTIVDTVEYTNLIVGKEYAVSGTLMNKDTEEAITVNGKEVTSSATFTAETSDGSVDVEFTFDATGLSGTTAVVFEDLYLNEVKIATHADINDEDQTVNIVTPPPTGDDNSSMLIAGGIGVSMLVAGAAFLLNDRKKKKLNGAK
ncbi:MAG: VaFE repeat-containing surface-anchored protein [Clostridiales bacterium]|nr:VaFE repeat-containing surface-anchored protein [Clostridiales bacterium]